MSTTQERPAQLAAAASRVTPAARLQGRTKRLLVDGIASAVPLAERQAALSPRVGERVSVSVTGLSPALTAAFRG